MGTTAPKSSRGKREEVKATFKELTQEEKAEYVSSALLRATRVELGPPVQLESGWIDTMEALVVKAKADLSKLKVKYPNIDELAIPAAGMLNDYETSVMRADSRDITNEQHRVMSVELEEAKARVREVAVNPKILAAPADELEKLLKVVQENEDLTMRQRRIMRWVIEDRILIRQQEYYSNIVDRNARSDAEDAASRP